jgi:hypothetical protein
LARPVSVAGESRVGEVHDGRADEQRPGVQNRIVILDFGAPCW